MDALGVPPASEDASNDDHDERNPFGFFFTSATEIAGFARNDIVLEGLDLSMSPGNVRKLLEDGHVTPKPETTVRAELKWLAINLYDQQKFADIYHKNVCGNKSILTYFLSLVHFRDRETLKSLHLHQRSSSTSTTSSRASSSSRCSYGAASSVGGVRPFKPCDLPKLRSAHMMDLEHWDCLYYALLAEIRQLYRDLQLRFESGFADRNTILHTHGDGPGGSYDKSISAVELARLLERMWRMLNNVELVAALDCAVRLKNMRNAMLIEKNRFMADKELLEAIKNDTGHDGYKSRYMTIKGLMDVHRLSPEMIVTMLWQEYDPATRKVSSSLNSHDLTYRLHQAQLREQQLGHEADAASQGIIRSTKENEHACLCPVGCYCRPVCNITTAFCACRLNIRHHVLQQEQIKSASYQSFSPREARHISFESSAGGEDVRTTSVVFSDHRGSAGPLSAVAEDDNNPDEGLFNVPVRRGRELVPSQLEAPSQREENIPNDFLGAPTNDIAQLQVAALAQTDPTTVYAVHVAQTGAEQRDRELLERNRARANSNRAASQADSRYVNDLLYVPKTPARCGKDQYPLALYGDYSGGNRYPTRDGRALIPGEAPPLQPAFNQPHTSQKRTITRKPVQALAPLNTQPRYDPFLCKQDEIPTPPATSPLEPEPTSDISNIRYPSIPRSTSANLFSADGKYIGDRQEAIPAIHSSFPAPTAGNVRATSEPTTNHQSRSPPTATHSSFPAPAAGNVRVAPHHFADFTTWETPASSPLAAPTFPARSSSKTNPRSALPAPRSRPYTTVFPDIIAAPLSRTAHAQPQPPAPQRYVSAGGCAAFAARPEVPPPPPPKESDTFSMPRHELLATAGRLSGGAPPPGEVAKRGRAESGGGVRERMRKLFRRE